MVQGVDISNGDCRSECIPVVRLTGDQLGQCRNDLHGRNPGDGRGAAAVEKLVNGGLELAVVLIDHIVAQAPIIAQFNQWRHELYQWKALASRSQNDHFVWAVSSSDYCVGIGALLAGVAAS